MERTLIIAKPDAVQRGLIGEIVRRLERKGLKLIGIKMTSLDSALLQSHYAHIVDKPFYKDTEKFMESSPVVVMAWEGVECTAAVRLIIGSTKSREADAGTIRGDFSMSTGRNIVHASDSAENGVKEVERFFNKDEIFDYDKTEYMHVYDAGDRGE